MRRLHEFGPDFARMTMRGCGLSLAGLALASPAAAQGKPLDRNVTPPPGAAPKLRFPAWTRTTLTNGAVLVVTQKHDLPLVALSIDFIGGSYNYEPEAKLGVGSFTAQMLSEGTATRSADEISNGQQLLGTSVSAGVSGESGSIRFTALKSKFEPALALLADLLVNPTFPAGALERIRGRTLVTLAQQKDQPDAIATNVFAKTIYGGDHPYGRVVTEQTVRSVTRDDVVAFHRAYFRPGRAVITVTGDVDPRAVRGQVEKALSGWAAGGERPTFAYPAVPAPRARAIYLVDKPKAAQSVFEIGQPGPARDTPDYYALQVMNNLLGGLFQSRLNYDIRELKGYSYGVRSNFAFGRGPGAFTAGGGIVTGKSDSALIAFMKHFKGVQGDIPFTDDEITQGKESLIQSLPARFASVNGIGSAVAGIYTESLPETFYQAFAARIAAVGRDDLVRVARKYIDLAHLNIVIVGDRATIEGPLRQTGIAPIVILDADGKPVVVP
ncbi:MAG TPA: pitrilysin family protein [Gemmatimonadaceae bacterium]|nr:pitrilysin family protein [Gemmatimonadaceae bacterium]